MTTALTDFLIPPGTSVKDAMARLEETEERILFVADSDQTLLGSVTDGDIRRWILAEGSLTADVGEVCNPSPTTVLRPYDLESIQNTMLERKIACIPVVDDSRRIVELLFWNAVFAQLTDRTPIVRLDTPVVIMAGGKGTRLEPFTRILPKPLIPLGDKTIIELIIDSFLGYGIDDFYISVNHKARIIKSFFEELEPHYSVQFLEEEKPLGTAGALSFLRNSDHETFIVTNCDILLRMEIPALLEAHKENKNSLTTVASMTSYKIPYGVCKIKNGGQLEEIIEKPEYDFLVNTGMYIVEKSALELIPEDSNFDMPDLITSLKEANRSVGIFPIAEKAWIDAGQWQEYKTAVDSLQKFTS